MIKTVVKLDSNIFKDVPRRQAMANLVGRNAKDFKNLTKRRMIESRPTGRFYRRSTKSDVASRRLGHQASARGQRPAIDTGNLVTAVSDKQSSENSAVVFIAPLTNALNRTPADIYAEYLQNNMNRPIMSEQDAAEAQLKLNRDGEAVMASLV